MDSLSALCLIFLFMLVMQLSGKKMIKILFVGYSIMGVFFWYLLTHGEDNG